LILGQIVRLKKKVTGYEEISFVRKSLVLISARPVAKVEHGTRKMSAAPKTRKRKAREKRLPGTPTTTKVFDKDHKTLRPVSILDS